MKKYILAFLLIINTNYVLSGPYIFDNNTEARIGTIAGIAGIVYSFTNSDFQPLTEYQVDLLMEKELLGINRISVDNFSNTNAIISDILLGVCLAVPAFQIFDGRVKEDWGIYGLMFVETGALSIGTTTISKNIFRETRPYVYSPDAPMDMKLTLDARQSFFSGHSCLAFAGMTFFAETYTKYYPETSNHTLIWMGSMTLASATALLRVFSGRHFPIDILIGSAVGIAIGKLIPQMHETPNNISNLPNFRVQRVFAVSLNL